MVTALLITVLLFLLNGFFSMCEIALVSSRRSRLTQKAAKGRRGAVIALRLLEQPEQFLSTVQLGITLVGIIAGAYGGEKFTPYVQPFVERFEWLRPAAEQIAFTLVVALLTYFAIIVGELVPKTLAFNNPEKITVALAPAMRMLTRIAWPLVILLSGSTRLILKVLFIRPAKSPPITEDELKYLIDTGARFGTIAREEGQMLHSVFRFGDQTAGTLMTPRNTIRWLNARQDKKDLLEDVFSLPCTRYPVCDGSLDRIIGVVNVTDILRGIRSDGFDIRLHLSEPVYFAPSTPALRILEKFREQRVHIGFVKTGGGEVAGLVTLHDLVENIVGVLPDSPTVAHMVRRADGSYLVPGRVTVRRVARVFGVRPAAPAGQSVAEFLVSQQRRPVKTGDVFHALGLRFEVVDTDGSRIDKVLVSKTQTA